MQDLSITKLSIVCSLTGIAVLYAGAIQMRPGLTPIAEVDSEHIGLRTKIAGRVTDLWEHPEGHLFLKLEDDSDHKISVPIFSGVRSELKEDIEMLDMVQVTGQVKEYNGSLELVPDRAEDVQIVHSRPTDISEINQDNLGDLVKIQGIIVDFEEFGGGSLLLTLEGGNARLKTFVPAFVAKKKAFPEFCIGDTLCVSGEMQLYRGELELKVKGAGHVDVIEAHG